MPFEMARRLVNNVWKTVAVDEDSGGTPFNGGTITARLIITPSTNTQPLELNGGAGHTSNILTCRSGPTSVMEVGAAGGVYLATADQGNDGLYVEPQAAPNLGVNVAFFNGSGGSVIVKRTGHLAISAHAAPADAELSAGHAALWFDQTDGAAKLKIKAKTADGTVVQGEIALAP